MPSCCRSISAPLLIAHDVEVRAAGRNVAAVGKRRTGPRPAAIRLCKAGFVSRKLLSEPPDPVRAEIAFEPDGDGLVNMSLAIGPAAPQPGLLRARQQHADGA